MGRHRKPEPDLHSGRIPFHRRIEVRLDAGKRDDLGEFRADLAARHAEDRAVHEDIFAPGQLEVEAGADLEEGSDPAADDATPRRRLGDARQDLEQRTLACPVRTDDAEDLAARGREGDVVERLVEALLTRRLPSPGESPRRVGDQVAQRPVGRAIADAEGFVEVLDCDGRHAGARRHTRSAKLRVKRSNTRRPPTSTTAVTAAATAISPSAGAGPPSRLQRKPSTTTAIGLSE